MTKGLILLAMFFCFEEVQANDSTYIKFVSKKILLSEGERFFTFSVKKNTILLIPKSNSDTVSCFVFKQNRLTSTGKLILKNDNGERVALRNGYWRFFVKKQKQIKTYFIDDEPLVLKDDIPIEESGQ
jgi:hypothetical protein